MFCSLYLVIHTVIHTVAPYFFRVSELEADVNKLQNEAEYLRAQMTHQKRLADSSARQRDMYRALLSQSTGFSLPPQGFIAFYYVLILSAAPFL